MKKEEYVKEIEDLMYKEPKCDFEHAWNCALVQAANVIESDE